MNGIFISHSTRNKELVEQVDELLQLGMGLGRERIFCTSFKETLPTGKDFISIIKKNMKECKMVIALITPEYLQSKFCMMELGAAWVQASYFCPVLAGGVDYEDLADTPLKSLQMRKIEQEDDWFAIYEEMIERQIILKSNLSKFNAKLKAFLEHSYMDPAKGSMLVYPNSRGFYQITVESVRKVREPYRCYKIKGKLVLDQDEKSKREDETHWIFFKAGSYNDLKKGDMVLLKVGTTERKYFKDIGWARNIYPEELNKVN